MNELTKYVSNSEYAKIFYNKSENLTKSLASSFQIFKNLLTKTAQESPNLKELEIEILRTGFPLTGQIVGNTDSLLQTIISVYHATIFRACGCTPSKEPVPGIFKHIIEKAKNETLYLLKKGEILLQSQLSMHPIDTSQMTKEEAAEAEIAATNLAIYDMIANIISEELGEGTKTKRFLDSTWLSYGATNVINWSITDCLNLVRGNVFGEVNQEKNGKILNKIQEDLIANLTGNLKILNDIYAQPIREGFFENRKGWNQFLQHEIFNTLPPHRSTPVLNEKESIIYLTKDLLFNTEILQKKIRDFEHEIDSTIDQLKLNFEEESKKLEDELEADLKAALNEMQYGVEKLSSIENQDELKQNIKQLNQINKQNIELSHKRYDEKIALLWKSYEPKIENLKENKILGVEKIKASQTIELTISEKEAKIKEKELSLTSEFNLLIAELKKKSLTLFNNPSKYQSALMEIKEYEGKNPERIANETKQDRADIESLKILAEIEKRMAEAEFTYLNSLSVLILDNILFPNGISNSLHLMLKPKDDSRRYILGKLNSALKSMIKHLEDPTAIYVKINEEILKDFTGNCKLVSAVLSPEENEANLIANVSCLIDSEIKTGSSFVKGGAIKMIERLKETRVNKYLVYSAIDSVINSIIVSLEKKTCVDDGKILLWG